MPSFLEKYRSYFRDFFSPQQIGARRSSQRRKPSPQETNCRYLVTPLEAEVLKAACENGGAVLVDSGSEGRPYAVVAFAGDGSKKLGVESHAKAAPYVEALNSLSHQGLLKAASKGNYSLTPAGWTQANKL